MTCRIRFAKSMTHELDPDVALGVMARASVEFIKTHTHIKPGPNVADPLKPGRSLGAYTTVANGVLASSYLKGVPGHYAHLIVGKGSDHDLAKSDGTHDKRSLYFR